MSAHRTRHRRPAKVAEPPADAAQLEVDDNAGELLALWRALPHALGRDSAGTLTGDRHASGAVEGSAATVNLSVVEASTLIEVGLADRVAEVVRILNADPVHDPERAITLLPDWHRSLAARRMPLARHLRSDLAAWVREASGAIGTRRHDSKLGPLCPEHRDEKPTPLLQVGDTAVLAPSLLAGPPDVRKCAVGPLCTRRVFVVPSEDNPKLPCEHASCQLVRERRLLDGQGRPTDWLLTPDDEPAWSPCDGGPAFTWRTTKQIRCPACRTTWTTVTEKRLLARRLAELGDTAHDAAALVS